ncbi:MAG: hypothetical protein IKU07_09580 [Oscillospiraceae bacterium]|nr:hypothetical protein [Oscillospiraceae bacterium]
MQRRILSFLCAVAILMGMITVPAFATTAEGSLQDQVNAYTSGVITLTENAEDLKVDANTYIDLNGHSIAGITVADGATVYVSDSQTDDYTVADGVYGAITGITGAVEASQGYVAVEENNTVSFHRVDLAIKSMSFRPGTAGVYYTSNFAADEVVSAKVESYGVALSVVEAPDAENLDVHCGYSVLDDFGAGQKSGTLLTDIMSQANNDATNARNAAMEVYGRAYIKTADGYAFGTVAVRSLQQQVEAIDAILGNLNATQKAGIAAFYNTYKAAMESWNIPNLRSEQLGDIVIAVPVESENGVVTETVTIEQDGMSITVPFGTLLAAGATELTLNVTKKAQSDSGIEAAAGETLMPFDVHVDGISSENTVPLTVVLGKVMPENLNMGNYSIYHVEADGTKEMTLVSGDEEFTAHNQFKYTLDGELTLHMATFSEVTALTEEPKWEGKRDYKWYNTTDKTLYIRNADQLAAFGAIVGGMAEGIAQDSFSGKTVILLADIDLADNEENNDSNKIFYPIGYNSSDGKYEKTGVAVTTGFYNFCGTFDGNGNTISNFYQNTWEMKGDNEYYAATLQYYRDGMGLFGRVYGGTVKNLTVNNFKSDGEYTTTGVIAAYADGANFENIAIFNCNPRVYNIGNGGIVGCVGWYAKEANLKTTFKNITVDNSNKISALWGSYDVACGGVVGQYYPTSGQSSAGKPANGGVHFENCHVSAQIDVYNDVCANYQYYAYRYAGMLIGSVRENVTIDGREYPKMDGITAEECTVHFGTWNDYYYCEIIDNTTASYTHDYQMSRLVEIKAIEGKTITYLDDTTGTVPESGRANYVIVDYTKGHGTENATCYHFKDGAVWTHDMGGVDTGIDENGDGKDDLKEDKQHIYLEFNNLVTGYGWGVTTKAVGDLAGVTILDRAPASNVKFNGIANGKEFENGKEISISELFSAVSNADIQEGKVQVTVSPAEENGTVSGTYIANTTDWTKGTLTFSGTGAAKITITDYYFCTPTTITVTVTEKQNVVKFEKLFNKDFLYRIGNENSVTLGNLFKEAENTQINGSEVEVTVENVAGNASGTYTSNATWTSGTLKFSGTGVVEVTITDKDYCTPTVLYLEVVDAENIASAKGNSTDNKVSFVLLQDVNTEKQMYYYNTTLYGNGFNYTLAGAPTDYNSKVGHGVLVAKNATFDNVVIVGDVYESYGAYTTQSNYNAAIDATNTTIQNCYIANCATPVRGNSVTITNTTLYGGTVANLILGGGANILTDLTTVNYNDERKVVGLGIVVSEGASENTTITLNGALKQYNYVYDTDVSKVPGNEAKGVFNSMFDDTFSDYHIGNNPKIVNTGIIIMKENLQASKIIANNAACNYTAKDSVEIKITVSGITKTVNGAVFAPLGAGTSVDNNYIYVNDNHVAKTQGDYLPTPTFALGSQEQSKDNADDTNYLIGDINGVSAMYVKGETPITIDLNNLMTVSKYAGVFYTVTAKCINPDGTEQTGTATLSDKGTYTLVFTVDDNIFYDHNGNAVIKSVPRTYEVPVVLDIYEKTVADATMTISSNALTGDYISSGTNKKYKMYPLQAISSIMDDANKDGVLETFDFKKNIQSAVLTPDGNNAFSSSTTITITYTGGQVLTIVLGTPSGLNSPGASNGGKTFSVYTDSTNGIYLQSDGAIASSSAATGTWPLTSWSFKGTSGKVVTSNTQVTINFTKPSSSGTCIAAGTMITMADGTKRAVEDLRRGDFVKSFNHVTGEIEDREVLIVGRTYADEFYKNVLVFDDGSELVAINEHGIYDIESQQYVNVGHDNYEEYLGHRFVSVDAEGNVGAKRLVDVITTVESGYKYDIVTNETFSYIAEDTLSVTHEVVMIMNSFAFGDDLCYDAKAMQADIEKYGLYTYADFAEYCERSVFEKYNLAIMKVGVEKGLYTKDQIVYLLTEIALNDDVQIVG